MAVVVSIIGKYNDKDIAKAQKDLAGLGSSADSPNKALGALGGVAKVAGLAAVGAAVGFGVFAAKGVAAAEEAAVAANRLEQVATSMGFVGGAYEGATARLQTYAGELSRSIAVEDETIMAVQAKLATFKALGETMNVTGGAMDRATKAAFDLAATGFGSAEGNAVQLGKALQDPIKGITALNKAGVTFTEVEKEKIRALVESGQSAQAQEMILKALESQVGGVAAATATASDKIKVSFGELQEQVGTALLPVFEKIADTLLPIIDSLAEPLSKVAEVVGGVLAEAFDAIAPVIPILAKAFAQVAGIVAGALGTALSALIPVLTPILNTFAELVNKIGPLLAPLLDKVASLLANVLSAVTPLIPPLMDLVFAIFEALGPILDVVVDVLMILVDAIKPILNAVIPLLPALTSLAKLFGDILTPILAALTPVIEILAKILSDVLVRAVGLIMFALGNWIIAMAKIAPFILENVTKPVVSAFLTMAENVVGAAAEMFGWVPGLGDKLNEAKGAIGQFRTDAEKAISGAADKIGQEGARIGKELVDNGVMSMTNPEAVKKTKDAGIGVGANLSKGIIIGIEENRHAVENASKSTMNAASAAARNAAGIKSPSAVFAEMGINLAKGLAQGIREGGDDVKAALQDTFVNILSGVKDKLKTELDTAKQAFTEFSSLISGGSGFSLNFGAAIDTAKTGGGSVTDAIVGQAAGVAAYGEQMQALLKTNLSSEAFAAVAALNREQGSFLATELLGGNGETLIANLNQAVESARLVAVAVGEGAALKFYGAGVESAQKTFEGFRDNFGAGGPARKALMGVMDRLSNAMNRESVITVVTRHVNEFVSTGKAIPRALGGPVVPRELYLVGERGPEFFVPNAAGQIIPNSDLPMSALGGSASGGSAAARSNVYSITINTGVGDPRVIGEEVVNVISKFEKANGAVFARA